MLTGNREPANLGLALELELQPLGEPRVEEETPPGKMQETFFPVALSPFLPL